MFPTHSARSRAATPAGAWLLSAAVAALVAALGLGWLTLAGGHPGAVRLADEPGEAGASGHAGAADAPTDAAGPAGRALVGGAPDTGADTGPDSDPEPGAGRQPPSPAASPSPSPTAPSPGTASVAGVGGADGADGRVTLVVDGSPQRVAAAGDTVADLLARRDVQLGPHDRVRPARDRRLSGGDRVVVERAEVRRRQREVAIAHGRRQRPTSELAPGERRVAREGRAGVVVITEEVVEVGGDVVATTEIDRETARAPREAIVEVGRREAAGDADDGSDGGRAGGGQPSEPGAASDPGEGGPQPGDPADPATWERLAECESGGNWQADTGNGFYGGLQFALETWRSVGGTGMPHEHPRETQIEMGRRLHARQGWAPWPHCTRELGYR